MSFCYQNEKKEESFLNMPVSFSVNVLSKNFSYTNRSTEATHKDTLGWLRHSHLTFVEVDSHEWKLLERFWVTLSNELPCRAIFNNGFIDLLYSSFVFLSQPFYLVINFFNLSKLLASPKQFLSTVHEEPDTNIRKWGLSRELGHVCSRLTVHWALLFEVMLE